MNNSNNSRSTRDSWLGVAGFSRSRSRIRRSVRTQAEAEAEAQRVQAHHQLSVMQTVGLFGQQQSKVGSKLSSHVADAASVAQMVASGADSISGHSFGTVSEMEMEVKSWLPFLFLYLSVCVCVYWPRKGKIQRHRIEGGKALFACVHLRRRRQIEKQPLCCWQTLGFGFAFGFESAQELEW